MGQTSLLRSRWAAVGAAVAVTLGASSVGIASATLTSGERTSFVPITPCRLFDTRPGVDNVGPRSTPLGPLETFTVTARGSTGNCTIPTAATGLVTNITAVGPTAPTFLTLWPTGAQQPFTSNLNPTPGSPPTPNAVTVDLSESGQFSVFNAQGSVNVFADIVGYYEDHNHDDRYYTKTETDDAINRVVAIVQGPAPTLTVERVFPISDTIVTPLPGRLHVSKAAGFLGVTCSAPAGITYFLTLDGVPIPSSAQITGNTFLSPAVLSGVTTVLVAAGTHTISMAAECSGTATANAGTSTGNPGPVTVLVLN
jgi:hypothetical protein